MIQRPARRRRSTSSSARWSGPWALDCQGRESDREFHRIAAMNRLAAAVGQAALFCTR
jgi:hypothetical protein